MKNNDDNNLVSNLRSYLMYKNVLLLFYEYIKLKIILLINIQSIFYLHHDIELYLIFAISYKLYNKHSINYILDNWVLSNIINYILDYYTINCINIFL